MLGNVFNFIKYFIFKPLPEIVWVPEPKKPKPVGFSMDHEWPFAGEKPAPEHVVALMKGLRVEGDHAFYYWQGLKRRMIRNVHGTETFFARRVVWWLEGREYPVHDSNPHNLGIQPICGEVKCIKLDHLRIHTYNTPIGPKDKRGNPVRFPDPKIINAEPKKKKVKKEPEKPVEQKKSEPSPKTPKLEKGDRTKCVSSKAWYATEDEARLHAKELNRVEVRRRNRKGMHRVHVYKCDLACLGWHLTSTNPKKRKVRKKVKGSWS